MARRRFRKIGVAERLEARRMLSAIGFDPTFGDSGQVHPQILPGGFLRALPLPNGGVLAVGQADPVELKIALIRYTSSGAIDPAVGSMGREGILPAILPSEVALQGDGQIL